MFLNLLNTGWCLYAHLVPEGIYKVHSSKLIPSKTLSFILILSIIIIDVCIAHKDMPPPKAICPMLVTLSGMVMEVRRQSMSTLSDITPAPTTTTHT